MFVVSVQHFNITPSTTTLTLTGLVSFITFGGAVYGFATGWSSYAADYNVNQPENTASGRVFWLTFLGVFVPCALLEILGLAFTTWKPLGGGDLLAAVVSPLGGFGTFLV